MNPSSFPKRREFNSYFDWAGKILLKIKKSYWHVLQLCEEFDLLFATVGVQKKESRSDANCEHRYFYISSACSARPLAARLIQGVEAVRKSPGRNRLIKRDMSDDLPNSEVVDQFHADLLVGQKQKQKGSNLLLANSADAADTIAKLCVRLYP